MITLEQKKKLQFDAGIPHLPTDLTYECRIAIAGEGERGWEWQDKPHRLVYDLCRQVEADADRIEELVKERDYTEGTNDTLIALNQSLEAKLAIDTRIFHLNAEALSEIKAVVDGQSEQSIKAIIYDLLAELEGEK